MTTDQTYRMEPYYDLSLYPSDCTPAGRRTALPWPGSFDIPPSSLGRYPIRRPPPESSSTSTDTQSQASTSTAVPESPQGND